MKYAVISTDNNPDYLSLVPLSAYSWWKLGYMPTVLCVGEEARDKVWSMFDLLPKDFTAYVPSPVEKCIGIKDSTVAQISRLFAYTLHDIKPDDFIITGDADMIVMKDIFHKSSELISYGHDLTGRSEVPICYVGGSAKTWRELMGANGLHIEQAVYSMAPKSAWSEDWNQYWSADQQLLTKKFNEYTGVKQFIDRGFAGPIAANRWDRYDWFGRKPAEIIDVHMVRQLHNWPLLVEMMHELFPGDNFDWMENVKKLCYEN